METLKIILADQIDTRIQEAQNNAEDQEEYARLEVLRQDILKSIVDLVHDLRSIYASQAFLNWRLL